MKKNIKILVTFGLLISFIQCKAQQVFPLNTPLDDIPPNAYVKDLNNELQSFEGVFKSNFQGNEVTLYITKVENKLKESVNKSFYRDALSVTYIIKNSSGIILQNTQNNNDITLYSIKTMPQFNAVVLLYSGTNCGVGWGTIYFRKINSNQIYWDYHPNDIILDPQNCPGNQDIKIYLPVTKDLIFTKQ